MSKKVVGFTVYFSSADYTFEDGADETLDYLDVIEPSNADYAKFFDGFEYEPVDEADAEDSSAVFKNKKEAVAFAKSITSIKSLISEEEYKKLPEDFHLEICIDREYSNGAIDERVYERSLSMRDEK